MIDDDELKRLFDDSDDGKEEAKEELPKESAPEKEEKAKVFDHMNEDKKDDQPEKKDKEEKKDKPKSKPVKKETPSKEEPKRSQPKEELVKEPQKKKEEPKEKTSKPKPAPKEKTTEPLQVRLQKIADDLRNKLERLRTERKENASDIPLNEREYLPNFPLSFRGTLFILLFLSVVLLVWSFLFQPFFRVQNIEIEGNIVLSEDRLIEDSGIEYGSHLFKSISGDPLDIIKLDYGRIEDKMIKEDPYIKDIQISVRFPSTIKMKVEERNKVAYIRMPDGYAAIDDEGTVIELVTLDKDDLSHAVICGLEVSGAVKGQKIDIKDEEDYEKALIVLGAIITADMNGGKDEYQMFKNVKEVRIIPGGNIFLTVVLPTDSELQVKLKDVTNINEDMSWLRYAIIKDAFKDLEDGAFDMTGDTYIYRKYEK